MKIGAVAIHTVALIPIFVLRQRIIHPHGIPRLADRQKESFDRSRKQQPITPVGLNAPGKLQSIHHHPLSFFVQSAPQLFRRTHKPLCQKSGIHQRLRRLCKIHIVRRFRIDGIPHALMRQRQQLPPHLPLRGIVGPQFQPGSQTAHQTPESLQMGISSPGFGIGRFYRHLFFQFPLAQRIQ